MSLACAKACKSSMTSARRFEGAQPRPIIASSDVGQLFGTYLKAAGFTECLSGNGKIYSTKSMKVATDALGVLPNSGDPFSQVELLKSDDVFNLSLGCNNLS